MPWHRLSQPVDGLPPKLGNLAVAARAGIDVPPTWWSRARELPADDAPGLSTADSWIVRSASPTEDGDTGSEAGQFHSETVADPTDEASFRAVVDRVVASLPADDDGSPRGCVFVQPLRRPERGGVAFFDGYYFERTTAPGGNAELTSGLARGEVERGHVERDDTWTDWLRQVHAAFPQHPVIDLEFTEEGACRELLQVRPASFPVRRNETLSLANHREILGERPSPWIVSVVVEAGEPATRYFADADADVDRWSEPYAVELLGRAWMNFGFFFRLMDHWGLPRSWVTEGVGGESRGPADQRILWPRFLRSAIPLLRLQFQGWRTLLAARRGLARFHEAVDAARTLPELFAANAQGMALALRTNFALGGMLSGATRVRSALGIRGRPRVVTAEMMRAYEELRGLDADARPAALDAWLATYGHRGPLESDPARPRFAELADALAADLARDTPPATMEAPGSNSVFFALERRREAFRDDLMRTWLLLRRRLLDRGAELVRNGTLDAATDVFQLRGADLSEPASTWREAVERNRAVYEREQSVPVPLTSTRDELLAGAAAVEQDSDDASVLRGIGLGGAAIEGHVRRADDVATALADERIDHETVLVVTALEPSWALLFGRVAAVVAEIGGELSHASILLREAGRPAVVNCSGAWSRLTDGRRVRVDPERGTVELLADRPLRDESEPRVGSP